MAPCQQEKGNCLIMLCLDIKFFSFAHSFRYFAYVLWFLMLKHFYGISICVCICMCFRCSFFDSFFYLFHPIQFCWFYFYFVVSGQQRPSPAHLPFGILSRRPSWEHQGQVESRTKLRGFGFFLGVSTFEINILRVVVLRLC